MLGDEHDRLLRELRQAGISRTAAEAIVDRLMPVSPDGTRFVLAVADDGTLTATPLS